MNKKLIAVAVAGALGAPGVALAQASTVQIYGTLVENYVYVDQGGGAAGKLKTDMLNTHDSNLGFKGEEALGGGLSGWFQCESSFDPTAGGSAGNGWCGRNSAFGMKGNFGNVYVGQWDTPMKITMANFRPFSTAGVFGMGGLMWGSSANGVPNPIPTGAGSNGATATTATSFTRRPSNSINYMSPTFSGFQAGVAYTAANEATGQTGATQAAKPRLWSAGVTYTNGPMILGGGYETHRNYNPGSQALNVVGGAAGYAGGTDRQWNLGAAYTFMGTLKVMGMYANTKYELFGGDLQVTSYSLHGDWAFSGPHRIRAGYTRAADTKGSSNAGTVGTFVANAGQGGTSGTLSTIQYAYAFSKRTELNFGYARIGNSINSRYVLQSTVGTNAGQDQNAWNLGVKHSF